MKTIVSDIYLVKYDKPFDFNPTGLYYCGRYVHSNGEGQIIAFRVITHEDIPNQRDKGGHLIFDIDEARQKLTYIDQKPRSCKDTEIILTEWNKFAGTINRLKLN